LLPRSDVWTKLNGRFEQQGNTSDMLFSVDDMVAYFSKHMTLLSGDTIATGTPPGIGVTVQYPVASR
jgi:2,4-diketo-3-deoxy-L-fuconate hydrolase